MTNYGEYMNLTEQNQYFGKYLDIYELADATGIKTGYIRYLKFTKKIPFVQESPGSKILIPYDSFIEYLNKNTNENLED